MSAQYITYGMLTFMLYMIVAFNFRDQVDFTKMEDPRSPRVQMQFACIFFGVIFLWWIALPILALFIAVIKKR